MSTPGGGSPRPVVSAPGPPIRPRVRWPPSAVALVGTLVALAVGLTILALRWDAFVQWTNPYGNAAGVIGLAVSVVGFFLTLLTMWDTRRISRTAQEQVEEAVRQAQESVREAHRQTRAALERTAIVLLVSEVETLRRHVIGVRDSGEAGQWQRAALQCQEATLLVPYLSGNPHLLPGEIEALRSAAEALGKALRYINGRLSRNQLAAGIPNPHATNIEGSIQSVSAILTRLRKASMEPPNAPTT